ncbi:MAG TPA: delta-60 repeat domain-containing protein, partial [Solirubrobacterales bacterium]
MPVRLRVVMIAGATLVALVSATSASAAPGELDPTFGSGGVVQLLPSDEESHAKGIAVQPDDKVVVSGYEVPGNAVILRLLENGQPDPGFGAGGKVVTPLPGGFSEFRTLAVQADGKIVAAGSAKGAVDGDFLLARYNADGSPDPGFGGGDGVTIVPVGTEFDLAEAVSIGPGGKIVATGRAMAGAKVVAGVAVLLANGTPDTGFAGDGTTTIETPTGNDSGVAVEMLADGRILIGDSSGAGAGKGFSLVQLLPTGAFDPSFGGGDGIVLTPIPAEGLMGEAPGRITDLDLLGDGRIITAGYG